jgi:hypothetical protein
MGFDQLFWGGVIAYLLTTLLYIVAKGGDVGMLYYTSVLAVMSIFVGSKIGRSFLGFA